MPIGIALSKKWCVNCIIVMPAWGSMVTQIFLWITFSLLLLSCSEGIVICSWKLVCLCSGAAVLAKKSGKRLPSLATPPYSPSAHLFQREIVWFTPTHSGLKFGYFVHGSNSNVLPFSLTWVHTCRLNLTKKTPDVIWQPGENFLLAQSFK